MISKVDSLRDFGIYKTFNWNAQTDIPKFKEKNIIYGWNYSGKTTFSRIFSSLGNKTIFPDYSSGDFKVTISNGSDFTKTNCVNFPYKILVFNSDYVKENLSWEIDDDINAILFQVGDDAKNAIKIKDLDAKIIAINGNDTTKGKKEPLLKNINNFNAFEDHIFTDESRRIKNDIFSSIVDFTKRDFKRQLPFVVQNLGSFILNKTIVSQLSKTVKIEEPKPILETIELDFEIDTIIKEVNEILIETPDKENVIAILEKDNEAIEWVKKGLELNNADESCLFCGNVVTQERINLLNKYYENQGAKLREKTKILLEKIENEKDKIDNINFPSSIQDVNEGYHEMYKKTKDKVDKKITLYVKKLGLLEKKLHQKINDNLYQKVVEVAGYGLNHLKIDFEELNSTIKKNNEFTSNFESLIASERLKYINHLVAKFLNENNYLNKEKKHKAASVKIEKLDDQVASYQKEIDRLIASKNSGEEGGQQFNYFVQSFLGKDDIEIKYDASTKKYSLYRGTAIAKNLSEGEKMAISFSHYLVTLKSEKSKDELKDCIVVIDDPMSSLDGNHIFQINSLLKDFLYSKEANPQNPKEMMWVQNCLQLFISTHNYEFFNLLKELPTSRGFGYANRNKKESRYFISRKINNSSIVKLPKVYDTFNSEYHSLFKEIYEFDQDPNNSSSDKLLLMPNILRRCLEIYTLAKYPSADEVDERATEIFGAVASKRICKPFHYFSHFNNIDRIGKQSEFLADVTKACRELIKQIEKDTTHYKALQTIL